MTGPEHYRQAQDWLAEAGDQYEQVEEPYEAGRLAAAIATAHGQLALAAAVHPECVCTPNSPGCGETTADWSQILNPARPGPAPLVDDPHEPREVADA